jgi:hypothetical protein
LIEEGQPSVQKKRVLERKKHRIGDVKGVMHVDWWRTGE